MRINSRCIWRPREGARNVDNTAIRRAFSPSRLHGSAKAGVHGGPRGVVPLRHYTATRDTPVAARGRRNAPIAFNSSGCDVRLPILFSPPGHSLATPGCSSEALDMTATSGIIRGADSRFSQASHLGSLLLPHDAFQEHAAHLAEWSAKLSSKGSERTCIRSGLATFLHCAFTAHPD